MDEPGPALLKSMFLPRLREEMLALREASKDTEANRKPVALDQQSVGRLSRMDALQQQAMAAAQDARRHGRVRAIEAAIRRLENEDFGWCNVCGEFIDLRRMEIDPAMMRCRSCAG